MKVKLGRYPKGDGPRRINIEIDEFDTWGLDHTLALVILPALIQLKNTKQGVPSEFIEDIAASYHSQKVFDFIHDDENEVFQMGCDKWDETMDKMIWSFQQLAIDENYDSKYHHGNMKTEWVPTGDKMLNPVNGKMEDTFEMVDTNPDEHWYDHVGHRLHEDRIQEGLELFGQYFRSLWD